MAVGLRTTLTDTGIHKRSVSDLIQFTDPNDVPLITRLGLDGSKKLRLVNWPSIKPEWLEDSHSAQSSTINEGATLTAADTTMTVTDGTLFRPGHVLQVESERMWVSARSGNNLTVVRGYAGTTAATHADGTTVEVVTMARKEGDESDSSHTTTLTNPFNYTQIFQEELLVSRSQQKITKYGIDDEYQYQLHKYMGGGDGMGGKGRGGTLPIKLEKAALRGKRHAQNANPEARAMGGLEYYITTNIEDFNAALLEEEDLLAKMQKTYDAGGNPDLLICNSFQKRLITSFWKDHIRTERTEKKGGLIIDSFETDFGVVEILLDRWMVASEVYITDSSKIGFLTFDDFFEEELAKGGDYKKGQVVGEYSFFVCNEKHHARLYDLATSV